MAVGLHPDLLDRRLLFFTGKGGVGKSTVAAAAAVVAAERGRRVLVIDVDAKGTIAELFEADRLRFEPRPVFPGVVAMAIETEASLREYLRLHLHVPVFGRLGPVAKAFDFVAGAAPGVREILTVGKICWETRKAIEGTSDIDLVIVDAVGTGHVVAQLGAPESIRELVDVGPVRDQTEWMIELLGDPRRTAVNIVTTPEEMPVTETIELVDVIGATLDVPLGAVLVNRVLPEPFTHDDEATFGALTETSRMGDVVARCGAAVEDVFAVARLAADIRRSGVTHIEHLREHVTLPMIYLPYLFARDEGVRKIRVLAAALAAELGL